MSENLSYLIHALSKLHKKDLKIPADVLPLALKIAKNPNKRKIPSRCFIMWKSLLNNVEKTNSKVFITNRLLKAQKSMSGQRQWGVKFLRVGGGNGVKSVQNLVNYQYDP